MMDTTYELWDIETANVIGTFNSLDEALDVVLTLLNAYGQSYTNDLCLSRREGTLGSYLVASGEELLALSGRHATRHAQDAPAAIPSD